MATQNYQRAIKIILQRKQQAMIDAQIRNENLDIPRVRIIQHGLAMTVKKVAQVAFATDPVEVVNKIEGIKAENIQLQRELIFLLNQHGYTADYLDIKYTCPLCEDTGYVNGGKCRCLKQLISELIADDFKGSLNQNIQSFIDFNLKYYSEIPEQRTGISPKQTMGEILEFTKMYAEKFTITSRSVLMIGDTGLGKTHLSLSIANEVTKHGYIVLYFSAPDLFRALQDEYFGKSTASANTMRSILEADLLILDDLGAEFDSQFNNSSLYNIVNSRLNQNKPMIINSNLAPADIERRYTSRVASRLMTLFQCLKFCGKDVRQIKLKNNEL